MVGLTMTEPPWLGAQPACPQRQSMTQEQSHKLWFPPAPCPEQAWELFGERGGVRGIAVSLSC